MDYEKEYKEAINRAKGIYDETVVPTPTVKGACEYIFPELAESEDEKTRKEIIDYLKGFIPHHDDELVTKSKGWIAWLEKMKNVVDEYEDKLDRCACDNFNKGYQAATKIIIPKFRVGDVITNGEYTYTIEKIHSEGYWVKEHDCINIPFKYEDSWELVKPKYI